MSPLREPMNLTPQERTFRGVMRSPLREIVGLLTGDPHQPDVYTYTELVQRAHNLLALELERITPPDSENKPEPQPTDPTEGEEG